MKKEIGRPTKLDMNIQEKLVDLIVKGNFMNCAAQSIGIDESTVYNWINRGKKEIERVEKGNLNCKYKRSEQLYVNFYRAIRRADATAEINAIATIVEAGKTDWKACKWLLSRRFSDRWGDKINHEITGENGQAIEVKTNIEDVRKTLIEKFNKLAKEPLKIDFDDDETTQVSANVKEDSWGKFNEFCETSNFKKEDLISKALVEFVERYEK